MPAISLNPEKMSAATVALYDLMSDGEWYDNHALVDHAAPLCAREEREDALKNGRRVRRKSLDAGKVITEDELIASGSKDMVRNRLMIAVRGKRMERTKTQHRMTSEACAAWLAARPTPAVATSRPALSIIDGGNSEAVAANAEPPAKKSRKTKHATDLIFGGIREEDGWASAPLGLKSRVHFRVENDEIPLDEFRADLPFGCVVAYDDGTGLYRVDCEHGTGGYVRDLIRDWCEERGYKAKALRAEDDVRRRNLNDLDQQYLSDLCVHYARYSQGRLRRHTTTLQFHFADSDDLGQQIFEWVLDAASRYDDLSGVPFGAFLSGRLSQWVHNLNREKYGRNLSDTELKYQRAMQDFVTEHGRKPTESEIAAAMGQDLATFRKNAQVVSTLQGLRNIGTLDTAPGETEVHLPDANLSEDRYQDALQQSLLSQVMTTSCGIDETARGKLSSKPNALGWIGWYHTLWGTKNKTELSSAMNTSMRNMNEYTGRAEVRMQAKREELVG